MGQVDVTLLVVDDLLERLTQRAVLEVGADRGDSRTTGVAVRGVITQYRVGDARFDEALELIASGAIDCDGMITNIQALEQVGEVLADLAGNPTAMKSLIQVN